MSLKQYDLFGELRDKVQKAIEIAQSFCPPEGYYLAYSGGKDSTVVKAVLDMAGVKYDAHYNMTTVDPPELVRFIIRQFDAVIYDMPDGTHKYFAVRPQGTKLLFRVYASDIEGGRIIHFTIPAVPMRKLIVERMFPPTQKIRYCCEVLKETNGVGRVVVTGVRWAESVNRKKNQGVAVIWTSRGTSPRKIAEQNDAQYTLSKRNTIILNYDDASARRTVEMCYRTNKTLVNPIIDYDEDDVWEFIKEYNIPYCSLYDEGWSRLGCVGCPMRRGVGMMRDFERWPHIRKLYERAFDEMIAERNKRGLETRIGKNGKEVLEWWTGLFDTKRSSELDQIDIEELMGRQA